MKREKIEDGRHRETQCGQTQGANQRNELPQMWNEGREQNCKYSYLACFLCKKTTNHHVFTYMLLQRRPCERRSAGIVCAGEFGSILA